MSGNLITPDISKNVLQDCFCGFDNDIEKELYVNILSHFFFQCRKLPQNNKIINTKGTRMVQIQIGRASSRIANDDLEKL